MKDWIAKGIYNVQDIIDDNNEIISFNEIEARVGPSAHRLLEYNALTSALKQAQDNNGFTPQNDNEADMEIMSLNNIPLHSLKSRLSETAHREHPSIVLSTFGAGSYRQT